MRRSVLRDEPLAEGPPLTRWTLMQGKLLSEQLGQPVYVGMRNWHPYIADVVAQMKADGVTRARVLCLAPQYSRTSVGLYRRALMQAVDDAFEVEFIAGWADEPLLAKAFAERLWPVWAEACAVTGARVPVLFTAHAVPCRTIMSAPVQSAESPSAARPGGPVPENGIQNYGPAQAPDPYPVECKQTAMRIAGALRPLGMTDADWYFAFQSQGIAGAPWIGPTVPDTLKLLAEMGYKGVVLQPVGFLCDHVEILYDIDVDFKQQAEELGMQLWRAGSLNDSPTLVRAIGEALKREPTTAPIEPAPQRPQTRPASVAQPEAVAAGMKIAIVGGGIAGLAAAYELELARLRGAEIDWHLYEASERLGGTVSTTRNAGFVLEDGPDGWVTDKPWAKELAVELGMKDELIVCNEATKKTYILIDGKLQPMPARMRMMVPEDLSTLEGSPLFSDSAKAAYASELARADELKASAPSEDESVASFVLRHFGDEVLGKIGAPLLGGVFGGDVKTLSVRAVMAPFVAMEREHGSLILALQKRAKERGERAPQPTFTSLKHGMGSLAEAIVAKLPEERVHLQREALSIKREGKLWCLKTSTPTSTGKSKRHFQHVMIAAPVDATRRLLEPLDADAAALVPLDASSAVLATFAWTGQTAKAVSVPEGFGFLVPAGSKESRLLACTFVDQKFPDRAPEGGRVIRAFYGGKAADAMAQESDGVVAEEALRELRAIFGGLPEPDAKLTTVRRWPRSLPQYPVGHLERMADLDQRVATLGGLTLLGNGYRGVGVPDLIRDARKAARELCVVS